MSQRTTRTLPTIEPIVPVLGSPSLNDRGWIYEPKFDGWRGTLYLDGHSTYIRSKRGNVLRRFWELAGRVRAELGVRDAILDGEVVAMDCEGRMSFNALERAFADGMSEEITTRLARVPGLSLADARVPTCRLATRWPMYDPRGAP